MCARARTQSPTLNCSPHIFHGTRRICECILAARVFARWIYGGVHCVKCIPLDCQVLGGQGYCRVYPEKGLLFRVDFLLVSAFVCLDETEAKGHVFLGNIHRFDEDKVRSLNIFRKQCA